MDITKVQIPGGTVLDIKDAVARNSINGLESVIDSFPDTYVTENEFLKALSSTKDDWYGIQWTSENTNPERVGNVNFHRTLPIQSGMKRCTLNDDGTVHGYIDSSDYTKYETGEIVDYSGSHGQVMVEIPEYNYDAVSTVSGTVTKYLLKLYPFSKTGKTSKKVYCAAFEGVSDDADTDAQTKKLYSIINGDTKYRGGNLRTSDAWDGTEKSQLGRPVTSLTRNDFRVRAANRGAGWSQQYWGAYMSIVRLYVVEYCNFNSQAPFVETGDGELKQGGLGNGFTNFRNWESFNNYNPISPCGVTVALGNKTGVVNYTAGEYTQGVPSYRGIENPWGHIWKWTDGINIYGDSENNVSRIYVCDDITKFADNTDTNYILRVNNAPYGTGGYIKSWKWDANGDFIPVQQGGSSSSYLYDHSWFQNPGWKVLDSGGNADNGANCGWFCFDAVHGSGDANRSIGGRLYYTPSN